MTILGKHTIDETRQIMRTAEFRMKRAEELINAIPSFSKENLKLINDWNDFVEVRWKNAHDDVVRRLLQIKINNPLVPNESILPSESEYQTIIHATNKEGEGRVVAGDLSDLIGRLEKATGKTLDESNHPLPNDFDPDLQAYLEVDKKIKTGEAAAKAAEDAAGKAAKSNIGLIIGLSALGIVGVVVATKVYL